MLKKSTAYQKFEVHQIFLQAANHLIDDVYVRIGDLRSSENILSADLYHHHTCCTSHIPKYESSLCSKETIEHGNELTTKSIIQDCY